MRQTVELISEMMILERRLVQVGAVAVTTACSFGRRGSGFGGFCVTSEQFGAVAVTTPYSFGRRVSGFAGFASLASRSEQSRSLQRIALGAG